VQYFLLMDFGLARLCDKLDDLSDVDVIGHCKLSTIYEASHSYRNLKGVQFFFPRSIGKKRFYF